jgi:3-deoxy-D-manno-octulosonate 8-phosphate phosphatase (KDO 8-P phosphatase)
MREIRLLGVDVDGTLTDGRLWYNVDGELVKSFHVHDGLGLKRLMAAGVQVAIVTARQSQIVTRRMRDLGIEFVIQGAEDKGRAMQDLQKCLGLEQQQLAFMGDDLPDLAGFAQCGLSIAVADAVAPVRASAHFVTERAGGQGAVREVCELILESKRS